MRGIALLRQDFIRIAPTLQMRQASSVSQQDIKSAFSYCVEQVRCVAVAERSALCINVSEHDIAVFSLQDIRL